MQHFWWLSMSSSFPATFVNWVTWLWFSSNMVLSHANPMWELFIFSHSLAASTLSALSNAVIRAATHSWEILVLWLTNLLWIRMCKNHDTSSKVIFIIPIGRWKLMVSSCNRSVKVVHMLKLTFLKGVTRSGERP